MNEEQIAEFEAACDYRQLRRKYPQPATPTVGDAVEIARHALIKFSSGPHADLACNADRAAATAVHALLAAGLIFLHDG